MKLFMRDPTPEDRASCASDFEHAKEKLGKLWSEFAVCAKKVNDFELVGRCVTDEMKQLGSLMPRR